MYDYVNKDYIKNHKFKYDGTEVNKVQEKASFKLPPGADLPKSDKEKANELSKKLSNIMYEKFDGSFAKIEARCDITETLMRKCINTTRTVTRNFLAKFCVGGQLSLETANELFILQGGRLDPENNLLDAVLVDALKCGDDITVFYEECKKYGLKVFSDERK